MAASSTRAIWYKCVSVDLSSQPPDRTVTNLQKIVMERRCGSPRSRVDGMPRGLMTQLVLLAALTVVFPATHVDAAHAGGVTLDGSPFLLDASSAHAALLVDATGSLEAIDVISPECAARFTPVTRGVPSVGLLSAAVWLKVTLRSTSDRAEAVVADLGTARLSHLDWFIVDENGVCEQTISCGTADAPPRGRSTSRYPVVFFTVPAGGQRTLLARARSDASIWLPLTVASPQEYAAFDGRRNLEDFAHLGWCGSMALFAAGLWLVSGRQSPYLTLSLAMALAALHVAIFNGTYTWLGGPGGAWVLRQGALVLCTLFAFLLTRITHAFFGWRNLVPAAQAMLLTGDAVTIPVIALCAVLPNQVGTLLALPAMLVTSILSGGAALLQWRSKGGSAPAALVPAWTILVGSILLLLLQFTGLIPIVAQPMTVLRFMLPATALMFLLASVSAQREFLETKASLALAREAEARARLESLRHQLNPHFLFNTLTAIDELSREAPARIPVIIAKLSELLRSLLAQM